MPDSVSVILLLDGAELESTVSEPASVPDRDHPLPVLSSVDIGSSNVTSMVLRDVASAALMDGFCPSSIGMDSCLGPMALPAPSVILARFKDMVPVWDGDLDGKPACTVRSVVGLFRL